MTTKLKHEFQHEGTHYLVTIVEDGTNYTVQGFTDGKAVTPAYKTEMKSAHRFNDLIQRDSIMDLAIFVRDTIQGKTRSL
jgi:hypothetical protein